MSPLCRRLGAVGLLLLVVLALAPASAPASRTTPRLGSHSMIGPRWTRARSMRCSSASHDARLGTARVDVLASWLFPHGARRARLDARSTRIRAAARAHHLQVMALLSAVPAWNAQLPAADGALVSLPARATTPRGRASSSRSPPARPRSATGRSSTRPTS